MRCADYKCTVWFPVMVHEHPCWCIMFEDWIIIPELHKLVHSICVHDVQELHLLPPSIGPNCSWTQMVRLCNRSTCQTLLVTTWRVIIYSLNCRNPLFWFQWRATNTWEHRNSERQSRSPSSIYNNHELVYMYFARRIGNFFSPRRLVPGNLFSCIACQQMQAVH